jgi:hypothetical protein
MVVLKVSRCDIYDLRAERVEGGARGGGAPDAIGELPGAAGNRRCGPSRALPARNRAPCRGDSLCENAKGA